MDITQPKCNVNRCTSRDFRLVGTVDKTKQKTIFFYQCSHGHLLMLDHEIADTKNPLEVVS